MAVVTLYRLAEQAISLIEGGDQKAASSISFGEIKIAVGQVINTLLKTEYFNTNLKLGEVIPNGSVLALFENIAVTSYNGKSRAELPVKPQMLPRGIGVFAIYPKYKLNGNYELDKEFIPLQMGQGGLLKSQPMISDLLGQVGYEVFGGSVIFTKDIKALFPDVVLAMRLAIMDISQYGDFDTLPLPPEYEWAVISEVYKMYSSQPIPNKIVDSTVSEDKGVPLKQQRQS